METNETARLREKYPRFRALILGRANAGKTTILKSICDTTEEPRIYGPDGEEIDRDVIEPTADRGEHNINNELVFSSNRGFVFHDSRGFESGSTTEVESVKKFIAERANSRSVVRRLHAIWYGAGPSCAIIKTLSTGIAYRLIMLDC